MPPETYREWIDAARERANDATALAESRPASNGPPYLAGYGIECALKAYLNRRGIPFPRQGPQGHDLASLWHASGFILRDLKDPTGVKAFFIRSWQTGMRYETRIDTEWSAGELVDGAKQVMGWILIQIRRIRRARS